MKSAALTTAATFVCVMFLVFLFWRQRPPALIPEEKPVQRLRYQDDQAQQHLDAVIQRRRAELPSWQHEALHPDAYASPFPIEQETPRVRQN